MYCSYCLGDHLHTFSCAYASDIELDKRFIPHSMPGSERYYAGYTVCSRSTETTASMQLVLHFSVNNVCIYKL